MNLLTFPTQTIQANETINYTWGDFTRLGKANVTGMLEEKGIEFEPKSNYFELCALLYQDYKKSFTPSAPISLAQRRLEIAKERTKNSKNVHEYRVNRTKEFKAEIQTLLF